MPSNPPDPRAAFDAAYDAADKAETLQRLDGLTKALPVAAIVPEHDYQTIAVDLANRIELAVLACRDEALGDFACRVAVLSILDPQTPTEEDIARGVAWAKTQSGLEA